jgi:hypothetical protein
LIALGILLARPRYANQTEIIMAQAPNSNSPADQGGDVGGIPGTLNQGVDRASDRKAARQDGAPDPDATSGGGAALSNAPESAAVAPREARDKTHDVTPAGSVLGNRESGAKSADGDASGQDDTVPESIGKAMTEPFKSS